MQSKVPSKTVHLKNQRVYKLRLTDHFEDVRIIPRGYDIDAVQFATWPDDLTCVHLYIGGTWVARVQKGQDFPKIYTSLLAYVHADLGFDFAESTRWTDVERMGEKQVLGDEEIEIFDGNEYHTGRPVTYVTVPYMSRELTAEIPEITFDLSQNSNVQDTISKGIKVPVLQFVTNIDAEFKTILEQRDDYELDMVSESSGYVTNYICYKDGFGSLMYAFA